MRQTLRETYRVARERHTLKGLLALALIGAAALLGAGYLLAQKTSDNTTTKVALCALRDDVQQRVTSSETFLTAHPNGIAGISRADIVDGIRNQKRTIQALSVLQC